MFGQIKFSINEQQSYTTLKLFGMYYSYSVSELFFHVYFKHASSVLSGKMLWQPSLDQRPNNAVTWHTRPTSKLLHQIISN